MSAPGTSGIPVVSTLAKGPGFDHKQILLRGLVVLLNLGSLVFLWWSLQYRLLPLQKQTRQLSATVGRLASDVSQMEVLWTKPVAQEIRSKYDEVQSRVFKDRAAMEAWLAALPQQITPLALDVEMSLSNAVPPAVSNALEGFSSTRAVVTVRPSPEIEAIASPFQRILRFSQILVGDDRRADLVGLSVAGGSNSVSRAVFELDLWAREETSTP